MQKITMQKTAIIGYGNFGKSLAHVLLKNLDYITVYSRDDGLPPSNEKITFSADLTKVLNENDFLVIAVPAIAVEELMKKIPNDRGVVITSKGISDDGKLLSNIFGDNFKKLAILSGPNFAQEILDDKISFATVASKNTEFAEEVKNKFDSKTFKIETSTDVIGVQVCGMLKNIYAIGVGMLSDKGENMKAAFFTKAMNEMIAAIKFFGGEEDTIKKVGGIGDFVLTCYGGLSRNYQFGKMVMEEKIKTPAKNITVEGYNTLMILMKNSDFSRKISLCVAIYDTINGNYEALEKVVCASKII